MQKNDNLAQVPHDQNQDRHREFNIIREAFLRMSDALFWTMVLLAITGSEGPDFFRS